MGNRWPLQVPDNIRSTYHVTRDTLYEREGDCFKEWGGGITFDTCAFSFCLIEASSKATTKESIDMDICLSLLYLYVYNCVDR